MKKEFLGKNVKSKLTLVLSSFMLGVIIYLLFRSRKLFYYQFVELINLDSTVGYFRKIVWAYRKYIPNWVIYSLPDGLWLFSMGVALLHNRVSYKKLQKVFNIIFIIVLGTEVLQAVYGGHGTFIGTYDLGDIVCYTIGYILASIIGYKNWEKNFKNKTISNEEMVLKSERKKTLMIVIIFTILGFFPVLNS